MKLWGKCIILQDKFEHNKHVCCVHTYFNCLKSRLVQIIDNSFSNKNGTRKYKFLVIGKQNTNVKHHSDSPYKYSEAEINGIPGFLVDNSCVVFRDQVFQQSVYIPVDTNCALYWQSYFYILI
jgi:hypothetical protein